MISAQINTSQDYKNLIVYKKSFENSVNLLIYYKTHRLHWLERFVVEQLLKSLTSIGANIAEGYGRNNKGDNRRFLDIAKGSSVESEHWINILTKIRPSDELILAAAKATNNEIVKMLTKMTQNLKIIK